VILLKRSSATRTAIRAIDRFFSVIDNYNCKDGMENLMLVDASNLRNDQREFRPGWVVTGIGLDMYLHDKVATYNVRQIP
jgi:hypothetical protein